MPLLQPRQTKHRKQFKGNMRGVATSGHEVNFGEYGIQALEPSWITNRQIESCRTSMVRELERNSKIWIRIFPDKPVTKKPAETRMGKGKGNPEEWVALVRPGRMLYEMEGVSPRVAREAMRLASHKLPVQTRFVSREEV